VLRLVAAGKGNREIAARLFVSPNTVANHVRSILTKTNTANRTEAAAFAVQHALVGKQP
jgi:DNA-binding NarL/FixJ family response regulator